MKLHVIFVDNKWEKGIISTNLGGNIMSKGNKQYLRKDFINEYRLTEEEYYLLPLKYRMEYCFKLVGDLLSHIREIGKKIIIDDEMAEFLMEFFDLNGCEVTRCIEDGAKEESTKITRVSNDFYPKSTSNEIRLNRFIYDLASAKARVFEDILKTRLQSQIKFLEAGIAVDTEGETPSMLLKKISEYPVSELSFEGVQDCLIHFQLKMLMEELESSDVTIKKPSPRHIYYFQSFGYDVIEGEDTITIKQKVKEQTDKNETVGFFKKITGKKRLQKQ